MGKKLEGDITITKRYHMGKNTMSIVIKDERSRVSFVEIEMELEELMQALTGLCSRPIKFSVKGLDYVGKQKETKPLIVEMPDDISYSEQLDIAKDLALKYADEGWTPHLYFKSQRSFFKKDGKNYANTTQYRFVEVNDEE